MNQYANLLKKIDIFKDNLRTEGQSKIKILLPLHPSIEEIRQILYSHGPFPTDDQLLVLANSFLTLPKNISTHSMDLYNEIKQKITEIYGIKLPTFAIDSKTHQYEVKKALGKLGNIPLKDWATYAIQSHEKPKELADAILYINRIRMLTINNIKLLLNSPSPKKLADIFERLHKENLDTSDYLYEVSNFENYDLFINIIENLRLGGIVKLKYIKLAQNHSNPSNFSRGLSYLSQSDSLTQTNIDFALKHNTPKDICHGIYYLSKGKKNDQQLIDLVQTHPSPLEFGKTIFELNKVDIATEDNINLLYSNPRPIEISKALVFLKKKNAYSPRNRQYVIDSKNYMLVARG